VLLTSRSSWGLVFYASFVWASMVHVDFEHNVLSLVRVL
jgi:hypothetical protein